MKPMKKRMTIAIVALVVIFGGIAAYKLVGYYIVSNMFANMEARPVTVSTAEVKRQMWQPRLTAVGQLSAVRGVDISNQVAGVVREIHFQAGQFVEAGTLLVKLNDSQEQAQLVGLQAKVNLARQSLQRAQELDARNLVAEEQIDTLQSRLQQAVSELKTLQAVIDKKAIEAPFSGTLGISQVDEGQYLPTATDIVTLQALKQLNVDSSLPEDFLDEVAPGQALRIGVTTYPDKVFNGQVTAVSSKVDPSSHNFAVQGILANPRKLLLPGMFADVTVWAGEPQPVITLPRTAISYSLHGDGVYVVQQQGQTDKGEPRLVAHQRAVKVGKSRHGVVRVLEGVKPGDVVVTAGSLKLYDGAPVHINNEVALIGMDQEPPQFAADGQTAGAADNRNPDE